MPLKKHPNSSVLKFQKSSLPELATVSESNLVDAATSPELKQPKQQELTKNYSAKTIGLRSNAEY